MEQQTKELINRLRAMSREQRAAMSDEEISAVEAVLVAEDHERIDALCRCEVSSFDAGPLLWLTRCTKTENPQYEAQSRALGQHVPFLAPFPRKTYFLALFEAFLLNRKSLFIPKSRTMMTSWSAAAFAAWEGQWKAAETVIQATNEDKAMHLIDYVRQLVEHQEPWLSELHPIAQRSKFSISWKGGGEVAAIPAGANAIRAYHPTSYIQDESAFMAEGEEALNAVIPTGAKIVCISTAAPGWFADECSL